MLSMTYFSKLFLAALKFPEGLRPPDPQTSKRFPDVYRGGGGPPIPRRYLRQPAAMIIVIIIIINPALAALRLHLTLCV